MRIKLSSKKSTSLAAESLANKNDQWVVYVMATAPGEVQVVCDIFVLDESGKLVVTASGVHFRRIPISKLQKVLG